MDEKEIQKIRVEQNLRSELESTISQRVERWLEIGHQGIIGAHHFAEASSECLRLYRDGYFISAVMVSQAVNEGIVRFIAERNHIDPHPNKDKGKTKSISALIDEFEEKRILSNNCAEASKGICESFRNDVHHMNPTVAKISFVKLAKKNLQNLSIIEKGIFGEPHQPQYWDAREDGKVRGFLRCE